MKSLTQAQIARLAGVNRSTVSRALRDDPSVSAETRRKIQELAQENAYAGDPLLRAYMSSLRRGEKSTSQALVALLIPNEEVGLDRYISALVHEARQACQALGYLPTTINYSEPGLTPERLLSVMQARGVQAGVIFSHPERARFPAALSTPFPLVRLGHGEHTPEICEVVPNYCMALDLLAGHVRSIGGQALGCLLPCWIDRISVNSFLNMWARKRSDDGPQTWSRPLLYDNLAAKSSTLRRTLRREKPSHLIVLEPEAAAYAARLGIEPLALNKTLLPGHPGVGLNIRPTVELALNLLDQQLTNRKRGSLPPAIRVLMSVEGRFEGVRCS